MRGAGGWGGVWQGVGVAQSEVQKHGRENKMEIERLIQRETCGEK